MPNQEIQQREEKKASPNWNALDVIFTVLPIICTALFPLGGYFYLCGRFSPYLMFFIVWIVYPPIGVFIIVCFFAGVVRLLVSWRKHTRKKKLIILAQIGIPIVFIVLFVTPFFLPFESDLCMPSYKFFMYGFRDRIRSKVDIEDIRDWLKKLRKEDCTGETIDTHSYSFPFKSKWPDSINWPKSLTVFNPGYVNLDLDENSNPKVRLTWGGPFAHWGVEIGMQSMKIPPSDFSRHGEYRLPLEPGVYVWHEIQ